ncbi:SPAC4G8.04 [Symbiodinium sp. CCMP2592]|nr:SPAC4G8.04 [Symbiodinium sp. CCMP2592]
MACFRVVAVNWKKKTPVKVHFMGYAKEHDEWLSAERLRSRAIVPLKGQEEGSQASFGASVPPLAKKYLRVNAKVFARLNPGFCPWVLAKKQYLEATKDCNDTITWALQHDKGCTLYTLPVFLDRDETSAYLAGVVIQEMIWKLRASSLILCGPPKICQCVQKCFSIGGAYEFELRSMREVCGAPRKPFEVSIVGHESALPAAFDAPEVERRAEAPGHSSVRLSSFHGQSRPRPSGTGFPEPTSSGHHP